MTKGARQPNGWLLAALFGAVGICVSLFAETFGLGSGNGQFGRWQVSGVLAGCVSLVVGLALLMRQAETARTTEQQRRLDPATSAVLAAFTAASLVLLVGYALGPSIPPGWDCEVRSPSGPIYCLEPTPNEGCSFDEWVIHPDGVPTEIWSCIGSAL